MLENNDIVNERDKIVMYKLSNVQCKGWNVERKVYNWSAEFKLSRKSHPRCIELHQDNLEQMKDV